MGTLRRVTVDLRSLTHGEDDLDFNSQDTIQIEGRDGSYKPSLTLIDKYAKRPDKLRNITLAQFATNYRALRSLPKDVVMIQSELGMFSEDISHQFSIWTTNEELPVIIKLKKNLGYMKLRNHQIVLRYHTSKKKGGHEEFFSEMLLFSSWIDEIDELHPYDAIKCYNEYLKRLDFITSIKKTIFPGEKAVDVLNSDFHQELRPQHFYDQLNCQTEQENEDQAEELAEEDLEIAPLQFDGNYTEEPQTSIKDKDMTQYKKIPYMESSALMNLTLNLAPEQKDVLTEVLGYCKGLVKARNKPYGKIEQLLLLVHGGAGNL